MPMIRECEAVGCSTLTMGTLCLEHEREGQERPEGALELESEHLAASRASRRTNGTRAPATAVRD